MREGTRRGLTPNILVNVTVKIKRMVLLDVAAKMSIFRRHDNWFGPRNVVQRPVHTSSKDFILA